MTTPPTFRLPDMIKTAIAREGSANRLAERINAMNADAGLPCRVNRKMLVKLRDHPELVSLTLSALIALNTYFEAHGQSLRDWPIFERRGILQAITSSTRIVFLLSSKPRQSERRDDISRWDNKAMAELLTALSGPSARSEYLDEDVVWRWPATAQSLVDDRFQLALHDDKASVISIGSPLASLSSEIMLAKMFGVEPFVTPSFGPELSLMPFYFLWRPQAAKQFRSAFALTWRELLPVDKALALRVKSGQISCFLCGRRRYLVPVEDTSWTIPGIIAAQRRAAGNVWLVLAGLAGPATFAAAELVRRITAELPWQVGENSKVLWIPIKARVKMDPANKLGGDARRVCSSDFAGEPAVYPQETSA